MIGTTGPSVYDYGGMIPGVATPFGMTHWTAMTRENKISVYSYNYADKTIQGFLGTHQPAIWMGDYGYVSLMPSVGELQASRKLPFTHQNEISAPNYYSVTMDDGGKPTQRRDHGNHSCGIPEVHLSSITNFPHCRYRQPFQKIRRLYPDRSGRSRKSLATTLTGCQKSWDRRCQTSRAIL